MEYDKINNLLRSEELGSVVDSESENLSKFATRQYVKVNIYLMHIMKINQLDLKHLCYDKTYVIMQMLIF